MDRKNKGLAENYDGDFVLNESGTSVYNPWDATESDKEEKPSLTEEDMKNEEDSVPDKPGKE